MYIREATATDLDTLMEMGLLLWPDESEGELQQSFSDTFIRDTEITYLAETAEQEPVGFCICSLRNDWVEGSTGSPTGYLEAVFVHEAFRKTGMARELVQKGELWCRYNNCYQMGSDVELDNVASQAFHQATGFRETNRLVTYIKELN